MAKRARSEPYDCPVWPCEGYYEDGCPHIHYGIQYGIYTDTLCAVCWEEMKYAHMIRYVPLPRHPRVRNSRYTKGPHWIQEDDLLNVIERAVRDERWGWDTAYVDTKSPLTTKAVAVVLGDLTRDELCL